MNALRFAEVKGHTYVEGYAMNAETNDVQHHAWVVDHRGRVADLTLEDPERFVFCGIASEADYVMNMQNRRIADPARARDVPVKLQPNSVLFADLALGQGLLRAGPAGGSRH